MIHEIIEKTKYSYNDIAIIPATLSIVESRKECNPYVGSNHLPIFTAPMSTVVDFINYVDFEKNGITPIIPRSVDFLIRKSLMKDSRWVALSLSEFNELFVEYNKEIEFHAKNEAKFKVLIDIANGHMTSLCTAIKFAKNINPGMLTIMCGNIANPETFLKLAESGADYVRVGIGGGMGCITSSNTGIHYPMASLVNEIALLRDQSKYKDCKIIADGGIRNYCDVVKAIALGADYVMIGGIFSSLIESAADFYYYMNDGSKIEIPRHSENYEVCLEENNSSKFAIYECSEEKAMIKFNVNNLYKEFYGMASAKGQVAICGKKTKTSEGIAKEIEVTTSLKKWASNMTDYIKSAMSYCNSRTLEEFKDNARCVIVSSGTKESINK